jgi:hypothetical protein
MAHNVPAVYGVLAARIRALRSKDRGWSQPFGLLLAHASWAGKMRRRFAAGMERSGMTQANRSPSRLLAAKRKQSCDAKCPPFYLISTKIM